MLHHDRLNLRLLLIGCLAICLAIVQGCDEGDQEQPPVDVSVTRAIGDFKMKLPDPPKPDPPTPCTTPKPDDIGCNFVCKPCVTFICVDGEWVRDEIDFPEGMCDSSPGLEPVGCPLTEIKTETGVSHRFCAAECAFCF
jgi:hypothetical protein